MPQHVRAAKNCMCATPPAPSTAVSPKAGCGSVPRRSGLCVAGALECTTACFLRAHAAGASLCAAATRGHSACLLRAGPSVSVAGEAPPPRRRGRPRGAGGTGPHGPARNAAAMTLNPRVACRLPGRFRSSLQAPSTAACTLCVSIVKQHAHLPTT